MMKHFKKLHLLIFPFLILFLGLLWCSDVRANGSLEITFEQDPLFYETNFLPGDSSAGWIKVKNNSGETGTISIWTDNVVNPDNLGDVFNLEIKDGINTLYDNTLSNLFALDNFYLSDIANNSETQYDLTITFDISADNEYQEKSLQFDLLIGSQPPDDDNDGDDSGNGGGTTFAVITGGGGGGGVPITLQIFNVKSINIFENKTTITWQTTLFATSQVIYSAEHESHSFNPIQPPNYGYAHIYHAPEDLAVKTFHTIILPGLEPCTTYYYRVVSHRAGSSSLTFSPEHSFTTLCVIGGGEEPEPEIEPVEQSEVGLPTVEVAERPEPISEPEPEELVEVKPLLIPISIVEEEKPISLLNRFLAALAAIEFPSCLPWWLILIFALYPLVKGIKSLQKSKKEYNLILKKYFQKQGIIWLVCILIPIILVILLFLLKQFCLPIWILLALGLVTLLGVLLDKQITKRKLKSISSNLL